MIQLKKYFPIGPIGSILNLRYIFLGGCYYNEHVEIGKQSSLKKKWEYPLRVQVSLFVKKNIK